jgi:RNA polymerase sigma-70 factor (ECF subfamily)
MDQTEATIWNGIQQHDTQIFERYYKENYKRFFLMACRYLKDPVQAEEIVNDVFMKIWEDGHTLQIESSLTSYLYKAVVNRSLNALRKNKRENTYVDLALIPEEGYEWKQMEDNEKIVKLYAAIEQLPEKCRQVFEMSRFEELKQQEIADKLGISIKTVKNHITLALKQLNTAFIKELLFPFLILKIFGH